MVHHINHDPPPLRIPFSCRLSGTNTNSPNTQCTQKRQAFLVDHVFSTPLNFKICPSPQSCYSVLSVLPHRTPSLESLDSKRGVVIQIFLFCFVYLCLFIIFRSESWRCRFDSLLFDSYHCHTIDSLHCRSTDS